MLEVCLKLNIFKRGKGFPRVKHELYSDPLFVRTVNEMIEDSINNSKTTSEQTLDLILFNTTTIAREVQRINKDTNEAAFRYLENEITNLKNLSDSLPYNDATLITNLKSYEAQYFEMKQKEAEHESFESKHSDYTNPHMPSKTFKPPPPPQQKSFSEIYSINDPNILITNQQQVEQELHYF